MIFEEKDTLIATAGLNITEVAHDIQLQVTRYVKEDMGMVNSYDTWHGKRIHGETVFIYHYDLTLRNEKCGQRNEKDY